MKTKKLSENILGHWDKDTANLTLKEMIIMYEGVSPQKKKEGVSPH